MIEIKFYARGGLGAKSGADVLAYMLSVYLDRYASASPMFDAVRRGAEIHINLRINEDLTPIAARYEIKEPDVVVVFDESLFDSDKVDVLKGLKEQSWIIVNSVKEPKALLKHLSRSREDLEAYNFATVSALEISIKHKIGTGMNPIINAAMAGALSKVTKILSLEQLETAILESGSIPKMLESNVEAAKEAYHRVKMYLAQKPVSGKKERVLEAKPDFGQNVEPVDITKINWNMSNSHVLKRVPISTRTTEGEKTGGWRNNRPVIDQDECTMCLMCQKKCPESSDSSIYVENNVVYINLDYCKGCGICAYECPKNAIVMQQEASFK